MAQLKLFKQDSSEAGTVSLKDEVFAQKANQSLVHSAVLSYLANRRRGTAATKVKGDVSGGGIKPWKQKGTGRARQGSIRAPQWKGGGAVFGPHPRKYTIQLTKKVRQAALRSALSLRQQEGAVIVLDDFKLASIKTKAVAAFLKSFKVEEAKVVLITEQLSENLKKSGRNIENLYYTNPDNLHPYHVMWADKIFLTQKAAEKIEEVLSK